MGNQNTDSIPEFRFDSDKDSASEPQKSGSTPLSEVSAEKAPQSANPPPPPPPKTGSKWDTVVSILKKIMAVIKACSFDPMFAVRLFERFIGWARTVLTTSLFEIASEWFIKLGHAMLVAISGLSLLFWIFASIKASKGVYLLYGIGYAVLFLVLQFTAHKFLNAGKSLIKASSSRLASAAFLDCVGLLMSIAGIMIFVNFLTYEQWSYFWAGLGIWFVCDLISYVAINPSLANIAISGDAAAGEEAIGIISFFVKAFMRIVPIAYGAGITLGFFASFAGTVSLLKQGGLEFEGKVALDHAVLYACLPFFSYAIFAVYHLTIDILRAILVIPGKLDQIRDGKGNKGE